MSATVNRERMECGCIIESPVWKNKWRVIERGPDCRLHIYRELLNIPSGRYGVAPRENGATT